MGSGAFEYNPAGTPWTFDSKSGISGNGSGFTSGNPAASEGVQVGIVQTVGTISQDINFPAGDYRVRFRAAQRGNFNESPQVIGVQIGGTFHGQINPAGKNYDFYVSDAFTVTAGVHTVSFVGLNPFGGDSTAFVDEVSIVAATSPPPPPPPPNPSEPVLNDGYPLFPDPPASAFTDFPATWPSLKSMTTPSAGWRIGSNFDIGAPMFDSMGGICIDYVNRIMYTISSQYQDCIVAFDDFPDPGEGSNKFAWPIIRPTRLIIPRWWGVPRPSEGPPYDTRPEAQYGWGERPNDIALINRSGTWKPYITQRSFYNQYVEYEQGKIWSLLDDDHINVVGFTQGQIAGFVKRFGQNPYLGCVGAHTNAGISGLSCVQGTFTGSNYVASGTPLMPGRWGGVQNPDGSIDYEATWNDRMAIPLYSQPQGCGPTNLSGGSLEVNYAAYMRPRLCAGSPQSPTEQTLLDTCITQRDTTYTDGSFAAYRNFVNSQPGRSAQVALMDKWGIWTQHWGAAQANGGSLWVDGVGMRGAALFGKGPENYQYQNVGFGPPGSYMWVSYALDHICLGMLFPLLGDGVTLRTQPEFEILPLWRIDGWEYGESGETIVLNGMSWAEGSSQTNATVNVYR